MPTDKVKRKVVAMVRKYSGLMDSSPARIDSINVAKGNLETALEAAEQYECVELASAVMAKEMIGSDECRRIILTHLNDPMGYIEEARNQIEKFKDYL